MNNIKFGCKPVIIDNSLIALKKYTEDLDEYIARYIYLLQYMGVSNIEISASLVEFLQKSKSTHYILKIDSVEDIEALENKGFSHAVLPFSLIKYINEINVPVILETTLPTNDKMNFLEKLFMMPAVKNVAAVRLIGDFDFIVDEVKLVIDRFHKENIPVDILPLNKMLTGVNAATSAYKFESDFLTLSFGGSESATPLEKVIFTICEQYHMPLYKSDVSAICLAAINYCVLFGNASIGLNSLIDDYILPNNYTRSFNGKIICADEAAPTEAMYKYASLFEKDNEKNMLDLLNSSDGLGNAIVGILNDLTFYC